MNSVYLDNAATTAIRPEVIERMTQVLQDNYGNASSTHSFGRSSKALLEQCRKNIARILMYCFRNCFYFWWYRSR